MLLLVDFCVRAMCSRARVKGLVENRLLYIYCFVAVNGRQCCWSSADNRAYIRISMLAKFRNILTERRLGARNCSHQMNLTYHISHDRANGGDAGSLCNIDILEATMRAYISMALDISPEGGGSADRSQPRVPVSDIRYSPVSRSLPAAGPAVQPNAPRGRNRRSATKRA